MDHVMSTVERRISILDKLRLHDLPPHRRIMIQQLNETQAIDPADLLLMEETPEHLIVDNMSIINDEEEYEAPAVPIPFAAVKEDHEEDERMTFWLPRDVCLVNFS